MDDQVILFEERTASRGTVGFAQLNAEGSLNALSQSMIDQLGERLTAWAARDDIACVVLYSAGDRAFCAGGDVIGLYHAMTAVDPGHPCAEAERFFATEYRLDYQIHTYPKPVLCWGHGTVMGGGLGLLAGSSHRVVTAGSLIAMPEISIGLFPDVGATWFLNRMPPRIGLYLALTGTPLNPADALQVGLADYFITQETRDAVFAALTEAAWGADANANRALLAHILRGFDDECRGARGVPDLSAAHLELIGRAADNFDVSSFRAAMAAADQSDPWIRRGAENMERGSPTSMAMTYSQLRSGRHLSLKQAFMREFNQAAQCTRHPDFAEGVRALLVDKDREPSWTPPTLEELGSDYVNAHFALPGDYAHHPLEDL